MATRSTRGRQSAVDGRGVGRPVEVGREAAVVAARSTSTAGDAGVARRPRARGTAGRPRPGSPARPASASTTGSSRSPRRGRRRARPTTNGAQARPRTISTIFSPASVGLTATVDPGLGQRVHLGLGRALGARDDGAGVAHLAARGGGDPGDVGGHRLGHVLGDEGGRPLLLGAADLADHHDRLGLGVGLERRQAVDEVGARAPGRPPMPTHVVWPTPCWDSSCRAW